MSGVLKQKRFDYGKYTQLRYAENARGEGATVDCWGLVCLVYKHELGIALPTYSEISTSNLLGVLRTMHAETRTTRLGDVVNNTWLKVDKPRLFDVVAMTVESGERIGHVGIVIDDSFILHADLGVGVIVQDKSHVMLRSRIVGYYRYQRNNGGLS